MEEVKETLIIKTGKIVKTKGLSVEGKKWIFEDNDPQIYIRFDNAVYGIRITGNCYQADFKQSLSTVYYKGLEDCFTETKSCRFLFEPDNQKVREIRFGFPINEIRFDPVEISGVCFVDGIYIEPIPKSYLIEDSLARRIEQERHRDKVIIVTHDLSATGAPILACHIAKKMKQNKVEVVVLAGKLGNGYLEEQYKKWNIPVICLDNTQNEEFEYINIKNNSKKCGLNEREFLENLFRMLRRQGFMTVITNTIVSGHYVELLKDYNFKIISLIHEMRASIELYGFVEPGRKIAENADYIVFPNQYVENDFRKIYPEIKGNTLIKAQGVYLENVEEDANFNLEEYGINLNDLVIMSSGTCELRKGVDLFVNAALIFIDRNREKDVHFIWTGNFNNKELQCWIINQLERSGSQRKIQFIPFIKEAAKYKTLLSRADAFWAMSREDPFPSTVLEAMKNEVPVVGFNGTGGIQVMLSNNRGILIDGFNLEKVVECTEKLVEQNEKNKVLIEEAKKYVDEMEFDSYVKFLRDFLSKPVKINPKLDIYKWSEKTCHYYDRLEETDCTLKRKQIEWDRCKLLFKRKEISKEDMVYLDSAIATSDVEDEIIMDYCTNICEEVFPTVRKKHIPIRMNDEKFEDIEGFLKILCGNNLLSTRLEKSKQWLLPNNIWNYRNTCLLGAGISHFDTETSFSDFTKSFLRFILQSKYYHSVCDEQTKEILHSMGIKNVINTSFPSMWKLTPDFCARIPVNKAENVLTTISGRPENVENDLFMLKILKENYKKVYIWIQKQFDYQYIRREMKLDDYTIIPPSLSELDKILLIKDMDYIGARFHIAVRNLNYGHRSLIIGGDDNAKGIISETNLPVLQEHKIKSDLQDIIYQKWGVNKIVIPLDKIKEWKDQFEL